MENISIRVGVTQVELGLGNNSKNLAHIEKVIREACKSKPDILLLPEAFNSGWFPNNLEEYADSEHDGESWLLLSGLSKELNVNIVGGSVVRLGAEKQVLNTTYVFDRNGKQVGLYDKIHLFSPYKEHEFFASGDKPGLFELDGNMYGVMICYDLRFPELFRYLALQGAKIVFVPAAWPMERVDHWRTLLRARAIENQCFVVSNNLCGMMDNRAVGGNSLIIDPWGNILAEANDKESTLFADINLDDVDKIRRTIGVFNDRKPHVYK